VVLEPFDLADERRPLLVVERRRIRAVPPINEEPQVRLRVDGELALLVAVALPQLTQVPGGDVR
jgi:hypothetical protein